MTACDLCSWMDWKKTQVYQMWVSGRWRISRCLASCESWIAMLHLALLTVVCTEAYRGLKYSFEKMYFIYFQSWKWPYLKGSYLWFSKAINKMSNTRENIVKGLYYPSSFNRLHMFHYCINFRVHLNNKTIITKARFIMYFNNSTSQKHATYWHDM